MATEPVIIGLFILTLIEGLADKVPVFDHLSHIVHSVLQPTAGAILFASQTNTVTNVAPFLAFFVGALTAGGNHGVRTAVRPAITIATAGHGNFVISLLEDLASVVLCLGVIFLPVGLMILRVIGILLLLVWWRVWSIDRLKTSRQ
jgi:Domain of unknown function (DUF4126)